MSESVRIDRAATQTEVGEFCRQVEAHLARVNDGHLLRIVGPAFDLVRAWALEGIPLGIACHGISLKAERHRAGRSARPLRLEFCEADVRATYDDWRRAVGFTPPPVTPEDAGAADPETRRRPGLSQQLDRAIERLSRTTGRLELPEVFRRAVEEALDQLTTMRDEARKARGPARDEIVARLPAIDARLVEAARLAVGPETRARVAQEAEADVAAYRARLTPQAWQRCIDVGVDRLLRERFGLPALG